MRRLRIYELDYEVAFSMFKFGRGIVKLPDVGNLPDDASVVDVHPNYSRRTIDFIIQSEEFEEAQDGLELPRFTPGILLVPTNIHAGMSKQERDDSNYLVEKYHSDR